MVSISVQIPMYFARSFLKKVSVTTALPIAPAGLMKNATIARQIAIVVYVGLLAHPIFPIKLQISEIRKTGRRPYVLQKGFHNRGAIPRMAIWRDVRYVTLWKETLRSTLMFSYAELMAEAVKVDIMA